MVAVLVEVHLSFPGWWRNMWNIISNYKGIEWMLRLREFLSSICFRVAVKNLIKPQTYIIPLTLITGHTLSLLDSSTLPAIMRDMWSQLPHRFCCSCCITGQHNTSKCPWLAVIDSGERVCHPTLSGSMANFAPLLLTNLANAFPLCHSGAKAFFTFEMFKQSEFLQIQNSAHTIYSINCVNSHFRCIF